MKMVLFKTLVLFDIETTGLPHLEHRKTKITEMSFIACLVSHCKGEGIPRVINKLTLALNPMKMISPTSTTITGLENELLEDMETFNDDVVAMLNAFLGRLPHPLCLVAHNGRRFDFPILLRHLQNCKTKLIDGIHCADSLTAFRIILPKSMQSENDKSKKIMDQPRESTNESQFVQTESRKTIDSTPERKSIPYNAHPVKPSVQFVRSETSNAARKLDFDDDDIKVIEYNRNCNNINISSNCNSTLSCRNNSSREIHETPPVNQRTLKSYKLIDIYSYLHDGLSPTVHRSEDDCMALLSCINKCKNDFINWLDDNSVLLSDVEPMF